MKEVTTISRDTLLYALDYAIAGRKKVDKSEGFPDGSPLTRYMQMVRAEIETASMVVPVKDDLIHSYNCGVPMRERIGTLAEEVAAVGVPLIRAAEIAVDRSVWTTTERS